MARPNPKPAPISLWDSATAEPDPSAPLEGDATAEVAIVGGGYTGLSTALHCARAGLSAHLLEAHRIGHGGSGRNVGLVNPGLWLAPQEVCARLGPDRGRALIDILGEMPAHVFDLINSYAIDCDATHTGTIHAAHSPRGYRDLARRARGWAALGAPVALLDARQTAEMTGTARFHGGLLDRRAGTINPMAYARGLARAAASEGAVISTGSPVHRLHRQGNGWRLVTDRGSVTARRVVLATNAYTDTLWPGLRRTFTPIHFLQVATRPLGDRAAHVLPARQGLWTTAPIMVSLRRDSAGRLVVGSMGTVLGRRARLTRRWAARMLARLCPDLGPVAFETAWHGRIAMTPDHLFRIHRLAEGLYAPIGYNGRGITTGTLLGMALADLLAGGDGAALPVPVTDPSPVPARALRTGAYHAAFTAHQLLNAL